MRAGPERIHSTQRPCQNFSWQEEWKKRYYDLYRNILYTYEEAKSEPTQLAEVISPAAAQAGVFGKK
ncbi:hypothetical protein CPter91_0222 [Collimonas pratensis]|uniref:Uncharacterized protein n=1 Tax=Collimonas pratensis TaxID=279113 RepID=A0A127PXV5_9BURK|nr:hypothetical protein CPter91_0222 [Collimonas pratensis]